jgi:hypothetical protein
LALAGAAAPALALAPPGLADARLETADDADPAATLARRAADPDPVWIGWSVPGVEATRGLCCWADDRDRGCSLARRAQGWGSDDRDRRRGGTDLVVLLRARRGRVDDVRQVGSACPIDGAGERVVWLDRVDGAAALALLDRLASSRDTEEDARERLLAAISYVADPRAQELLERRATDAALDRETRRNAIFWLGQTRGEPGVAALERLLDREGDGELREQALFSLSQTGSPRATDRIERAAVEDRDPEVRSKAFFWLAQTGGAGIGEWISRRIALEPDHEVREQAVFALSQLDDAATWLVALLRSTSDRELARQALFWLGQTDDPRALEEFARILDSPRAGGSRRP